MIPIGNDRRTVSRRATPSELSAGRKALERWRNDPVAFSREVLGVNPWSKQREILRALASGKRFIACKSGHKIGKSDVAADAALWFTSVFPDSRVILTAPSAHQIQNIVWRSVKRMYDRALIPLGGECFGTAHIGLRYSDGREIIGLSTDVPERFAGISAPNLMFVVDEASGVEEKIFEAIFGNTAGNATVLLLSNPTKTSGTFYDAFNSKRANWHTISVASTETPNFDPSAEPIPGLATPEFVEFAKKQWGIDSPHFSVRVLGEFPSQSENSVIGIALISSASERWQPYDDDSNTSAERFTVGVDVARFGDDATVIQAGRGFATLLPVKLNNQDGGQVADRVCEIVDTWRRTDEIALVKCDGINAGAAVFDALQVRAAAHHIEVIAVNSAEQSNRVEEFPNLRSQLWFDLRDWLRAGGTVPPNEELSTELAAPTYAIDAKGRTVVEPKDRFKKRLRRSPDHADALALYAYDAGAAVPSFDNLARFKGKRTN